MFDLRKRVKKLEIQNQQRACSHSWKIVGVCKCDTFAHLLAVKCPSCNYQKTMVMKNNCPALIDFLKSTKNLLGALFMPQKKRKK